MKFTFGIITSGNQDSFISTIIDTIEMENIPKYEIIIVGNSTIKRKNTSIIFFDENKKSMWITRKKNLITDNASYQNIVYMHDYIALCPGWYKAFLEFGDNWKVCMTPMVNGDGSRYRDWTLWIDAHNFGATGHELLLPYNEVGLSKIMYISGAYWVAKRQVMEDFRLNENLVWGEGEDVEWSKNVTQRYDFSINANAKVSLLKYKGAIFCPIKTEDLEKVKLNYKNKFEVN